MILEEDKRGCVEILRLLGWMNLLSLCDTVTGKLVAPVSEEEAIDAIIRYSHSAEELLNRKKLKHEVLFQYLHQLNAQGVSPKSTKAELVGKALLSWRESKRQELCQASCSPVSSTVSNQVSLASPTNVTINHTTVINKEIRNFTAIVAKAQDDTGQRMAQEFIQWFYHMLNNLKDQAETTWGAQHFWPDSCLALEVVNAENRTLRERIEGADAMQEKLAFFVKQEGVIFNPNTTPEGYRGAVSPHGLAKVAVSGTLHKLNVNHEQLAGIFEQCFALMRDVNDGNRWKIKYSDLKIQIAVPNFSGQIAQIPLSKEALKAVFEQE